MFHINCEPVVNTIPYNLKKQNYQDILLFHEHPGHPQTSCIPDFLFFPMSAQGCRFRLQINTQQNRKMHSAEKKRDK